MNGESKLEFDIFGDFSETKYLTNFEIVSSSFLYPQDIVIIDSLVIANERDSDPMIVRFNMSTQSSDKFLRKGRGPGETTNLLSVRAYGDSLIQASVDPETLFIYDIYDIDKRLPIEIISLKQGSYAFSTITKTGTGDLIYCGKDPENKKSDNTRFCIYEPRTDSVYCFGEYPSEDNGIKDIPAEDFSRPTAYQGNIIVKPDNSKAVAIYLYAVGFDIINIEERSVLLSKFYQYPQITTTWIPDLNINAVRRIPEAYRGFIDSFCSNEHIYFLYSGKTFNESNYSSGRHILKYDWNGKPVCHYILEEDVDTFAMDKNEENIYATKIDEEAGYLIRYGISHQ